MALTEADAAACFFNQTENSTKMLFRQQCSNQVCGNVLQAEEPKAKIRSIGTKRAQLLKIRAVTG